MATVCKNLYILQVNTIIFSSALYI